MINYTTKHEIEHVIIEYLSEIFLCADNPQLQSFPLLDEFCYACDTLAGDKVTVGTYISPLGTDEHTQLFLQCM